MNEKENNVKEMNKEENHRSFWKKFNEKWLWVNIGSYIVGTILLWWLFFIGITNLMTVIFLTISTLLIIPLMYYFFNYFRKSKHQTIIIKIMLVGCGGFSLGIFIWFFIGYTFIMAPWAPLNNLTGVLRQSIFLLLLIFSWGLAAYIMYRIGKKRDWRPPSHLIN